MHAYMHIRCLYVSPLLKILAMGLNSACMSFNPLTYNIHHGRGATTDSLAAVIGCTGVGPSITRAQKRFTFRMTTITVIITTRHKAAATC